MADARSNENGRGPRETATATNRSRLDALHPRRFFLEAWEELDRMAPRADTAGRSHEPAIALVVATLALIFMEYAGSLRGLRQLLAFYEGPIDPALSIETHLKAIDMWELAKLAHWCGFRVLGFFVVPAIVLLARGRSIRDQHLSVSGLREHAWIYAVAYAAVLACVVGVSFTHEFSTYYPFYDRADRSVADLLAWELMYAAQFFALEFFFRGYLLASCRSLGSAAIFVSAVPYVMIHFGKPVAETVGALFAGVFLGTLAMRTRSIWLGFAIHVSVALSMDLAALLQTRGLPSTFYPPGFGG